MPLFWFFAGVLTTFAVVVAALPWLRTLPRYASLPVLPWQASVGAVVIAVAFLGVYPWIGHSGVPGPAMSRVADNSGGAFGNAVKAFADSSKQSSDAASSSSAANPANPATKSNAGSMNTAIASLESRLAKGGGSDGDWELLAKSFDFLGRPADAAKARARQLPPVPTDAGASANEPGAAAPSAAPNASAPLALRTAVSGEIRLAPELKSKAAAGETLFIVAKSVDSPGAPVAVFRGSVGSWPLKFTLDDSQSMMPGRNLSSAGRVTIEARISQKGQPLPASGDLQGSTGVINPADHQTLKILIDRVIT
jgi:hypothetical protein